MHREQRLRIRDQQRGSRDREFCTVDRFAADGGQCVQRADRATLRDCIRRRADHISVAAERLEYRRRHFVMLFGGNCRLVSVRSDECLRIDDEQFGHGHDQLRAVHLDSSDFGNGVLRLDTAVLRDRERLVTVELPMAAGRCGYFGRDIILLHGKPGRIISLRGDERLRIGCE